MSSVALFFPFAHAGHWAMYVVYAVPVVVVLASVVKTVLAERRAGSHAKTRP
jgi:heme exporter protein D